MDTWDPEVGPAGRVGSPAPSGSPHRQRAARPRLAAGLAALCLAGIATTFWFEDWRYALPTRIPDDHVPVAPGAIVSPPAPLAAVLADRPARPLVLHFFNPDCPCSRFNLDHLRALVRDLDGEVDFVLVQERDDGEVEPVAIRALDIPAIVDVDGSIADCYGVYSTPVAAVVDASGAVAYIGNYASSRYCVDPAEEYVRIVLEALAEGRRVDPETLARPATYGCPLPSDVERARG